MILTSDVYDQKKRNLQNVNGLQLWESNVK